jgi:TPR repeat protein
LKQAKIIRKHLIYFINASEKNHTLAQYYVGLCYEYDRGTVKDVKLAFEYYEKLANMGYASGLVKIGYFYNKGIGTSVNKQKAFELYQQAAKLGNNYAQNNLAIMYEYGEGIERT